MGLVHQAHIELELLIAAELDRPAILFRP